MIVTGFIVLKCVSGGGASGDGGGVVTGKSSYGQAYKYQRPHASVSHLYPPPPPLLPHSPSLISHLASVDVKQYVYLLFLIPALL